MTDKGTEAERDMLDEYRAWLEKRGPLGVGASPERIFFAGYSAGRRAQSAAVGAEGLPPLPKPVGTIYPGNYWTASEQATPPGTAIAAIYTAEQVEQMSSDAWDCGRLHAALEALNDQARAGQEMEQPVAVGSIEDYAQFHMLHGAWLSARDYWQDEASTQVAEAWNKFIAYIDAWTGRRAPTAPSSATQASAAPAERAALPTGWKLVPIEPTEAMVHAGEDVPAPRPFGKVYRAMLGAAPAPYALDDDKKGGAGG